MRKPTLSSVYIVHTNDRRNRDATRCPKIVLAGGHAHLHALRRAAGLTGRGFDVTLVDPSPYFCYSGMATGVISGIYAPEKDRVDVRWLVETGGGSFVEVRGRGLQGRPRPRTSMTVPPSTTTPSRSARAAWSSATGSRTTPAYSRLIGSRTPPRSTGASGSTVPRGASPNARIFGGGDAVSYRGVGLPKLGVFAIRQGPVLYLQAVLRGEPLRRYRPQKRFLYVLRTLETAPASQCTAPSSGADASPGR